MKKIVILTLELPFKNMGQNTVFAIQHIGNRKSFTEVLPPS